MARYTSMQIFEFNRSQEYRAVIPDSGTSVAVEIWSGAEWVPDPLSPITTPRNCQLDFHHAPLYYLGINKRGLKQWP